MRTDLGSAASFGPVDLYGELRRGRAGIGDADVITPETKNDNQERRQEIVGRGALSLTDTWALLASLRYDLAKREDDQRRRRRALPGRLLDAGLVTYEQSNIQDRDHRARATA